MLRVIGFKKEKVVKELGSCCASLVHCTVRKKKSRPHATLNTAMTSEAPILKYVAANIKTRNPTEYSCKGHPENAHKPTSA
jgi:hypothetical protein